jgi:transposase
MGAGGRPLVIAWAPEDDAARLKGLYQAERRADVRPRLHALWLLRTGRRIREVAAVLGVHERNVQRWVSWYRAGGVAEVSAHRRQGAGQRPLLTADQQAQLRAQAATGAFRTAAEARRWVQATFGVSYRAGGMYDLLARLRIHPKVPRPRNPKADAAVQDAWKRGA